MLRPHREAAPGRERCTNTTFTSIMTRPRTTTSTRPSTIAKRPSTTRPETTRKGGASLQSGAWAPFARHRAPRARIEDARREARRIDPARHRQPEGPAEAAGDDRPGEAIQTGKRVLDCFVAAFPAMTRCEKLRPPEGSFRRPRRVGVSVAPRASGPGEPGNQKSGNRCLRQFSHHGRLPFPDFCFVLPG